MSPIAQRFFIASLIYLLLGLLLQAVAVFDVWLGFNPLAYTVVTATEQMLLLGWLTQLGLAFVYDHWLLARREEEPPAKASHSKTATVVFVLFNTGLPLVIVGQPGLVVFGGRWLGAVAASGSLLQLLAGLVFVGDVWKWFRKK